MLSLTNKKGGSRMKILNEVIKEKPDSKHIDLCCNGSYNLPVTALAEENQALP